MCLTLDVEAADVHNSGRSMAKWFGLVFFPCRWQHHERRAALQSNDIEPRRVDAITPAV
jgi:hypothetical protein